MFRMHRPRLGAYRWLTDAIDMAGDAVSAVVVLLLLTDAPRGRVDER